MRILLAVVFFALAFSVYEISEDEAVCKMLKSNPDYFSRVYSRGEKEMILARCKLIGVKIP